MAKPSDENDLAAVTDYGTRVPAMVARETCSAASFTRKRAVKWGFRCSATLQNATEVGK